MPERINFCMLFGLLELKDPDIGLVQASVAAFAAACFIPFLIESVFGHYALAAFPWIFLAVSFHEVGHLVFIFLVTPLLYLTPFAGLAMPFEYLGGYFFSCFCAVAFLWFSLWAYKRVQRKSMAFSFMLIGYVNVYFVNVTLTHLPSVVGPGLDFTMASGLLNLTLTELLALLWPIHWLVMALAVFLNVFFVFRAKPASLQA
jgi:hypothetical protein